MIFKDKKVWITGASSGIGEGTMDEATQNSFATEEVAAKIVKALRQRKKEIVIAKGRERLATYLKRFTPHLLSRMVRNAKTT